MATMSQVFPAMTMTPATVPQDAGEAYSLIEGLVYDQVHRFARQFGGDFEELLGEAHLAFLRGHIQFLTGAKPSGIPIKHPYAVEIRQWIWFDLLDATRTRLRRNASVGMVSLSRDDISPAYDIADNGGRALAVLETLDALGDDARYVAELALNTPEDLAQEAEAKGGEARNYRSTIRTYLAARGWDMKRIAAAFDEIREAV